MTEASAQFLSKENRGYILDVLRGFLSQRFRIQVEDARLAAHIEEAIPTIFQEHGRTDALDVLNRRVIVAVKNVITTTKEPPMDPISEETDENLFIRKVQQLEEQRRMPITAAVPAEPAPMVDEVTETKVAPPAPVATTLYVPAPMEYHHPICIHAWEREWMLYNERCLFAWNGPIPPIVDRGSVQLAALLLPLSREVAAQSPYVKVCIEGAGRQRSETLCVSSDGSGCTWRPCSKELSYIRAYAIPWTITLRGADDHPLDLGLDGWRITRAVAGAPGDMSVRLTLVHDSYPEEVQRLRGHFSAGEWVRVQGEDGSGGAQRMRVSAVFDAQCALDLFLPLGETEAAFSQERYVGKGVLNMSRQPVLVLGAGLKK